VIGCVVLAAGAGRRFGASKQLALLQGRPLLQWVLDCAAAAPVDRCVLVLGADAARVRAGIAPGAAEVVECADWSEGMAASLRCGFAALSSCEANVVLLGDQPRVDPRAIARLIANRDPGVDAVRATYDGVAGPPVLIERSLFGDVQRLRGDVGARALLATGRVRDVACDDLGSGEDVDTAADLDRAARRGPRERD
jgi:molybdenum cofactor cytidylyltransferase